MAILHGAFLVSAGAEVFVAGRWFPGWFGFAALGLVLLSQGLRYAAVATLGQRWNVRIIVWPGERPITSGPYRWVRHPNYVAVIVEICFLPLVHGAWVTSAVFSVANAWMLSVRIREEERALGALYEDVFRTRPRFLPAILGG